MSQISIRNLSKKLGARAILKDINFEIKPSEINIILGANGAGKSTLMRAILNLTTHSGDVFFGEQMFNKMHPAERAQIAAYLAQNTSPEWNMRVKDLVALGRIPWQILGKTDQIIDDVKITKALEMLDISHLAMRNIHEISGGELALCLMARVFAGEPEFIFVDEPLNSLDIKHQYSLIEAIKKYAKGGHGILMIIHDLALAAQMGDKFILLKDGEIIANGNRREVFTQENFDKAFDTNVNVLGLELLENCGNEEKC